MNQLSKVLKHCPLFYRIWAPAMVLLPLLFLLLDHANAALGILLWGLLILAVYFCRPGSRLHSTTVEGMGKKERVILILVAALTVAACVLPMSASPHWNGQIPDHRDQYERLTESILEGHVYLDYGTDGEALAALENPYDPQARKDSGLPYHWDHAYYNGRYYMYFGVVPVFLAFLPYRVVTGVPLTTYHATQLFVTVAIVGIFMLLLTLARLFFKKLPFAFPLLLSAAFSLMSFWYSVSAPALYCTAITGAICLEVRSLYFFVRAVWICPKENGQIASAALGALLGALAFGCRPPIALGNQLVIPMLVAYLRRRRCTPRLLGKLALAALPYLAVAAALMYYNYVRFDDPFEFGQTYQLTIADQTQKLGIGGFHGLVQKAKDTVKNFIGRREKSDGFSGALIQFPILCLSAGAALPAVFRQIGAKKLGLFILCLGLLPILITFVDVLWSPFLLERYRMDIYFLMAILCFMVVGFWYCGISPARQRYFASFVMLLALATVLSGVKLFLTPHDHNLAEYRPEVITNLKRILLFWQYW